MNKILKMHGIIRCPIVLLVFPLMMIPLIIGGFINKRIHTYEFWNNNYQIFKACYLGGFLDFKLKA